MVKHIRDCTVAEAHRHHGDSSWDLTVAELKAFIALLYVRGAQGAKHIDVDSLWSDKWGLPFFTETMARNRFREIMKFLRFDKKETRRIHLQDDKFALVSATWNKFVQNSIACYKPGADIMIDEQLFPTKAWCKFIQYTGNKPDKFGIKFWLAVAVQSKYMLNGAPYLGEEETRSKGQLVGESVVLKLAEPFLGKGRNITTDNFFTSLKLATALQAKKTSLVGTLGKAKRELPPSVKEQAELFSTKVLKCANATLTIYQGTLRKNVCILTSVHTSVGITDGPKAKPESVTYNTKYGVDVLDQMAKAYSVKGGTQRWQQDFKKEVFAAVGRGAESRVYGGEKGNSARSRSAATATTATGTKTQAVPGEEELQSEQDNRHLQHMPQNPSVAIVSKEEMSPVLTVFKKPNVGLHMYL
ncbi:uncharacterized protein LOC144524169 [Sander vitreus]